MSLKERITEDTKAALRSGDKTKLNLIRMLRWEIRHKEIERGSESGEDETIEVLSWALKKRREGIEEFRKGGREDLVSQEEREEGLILGYLPRQLPVERLIDQSIVETDAQSPRDIGKVVRIIVPKVKRPANGEKVNQLVWSRFQGT